ncbi:sigma-70 family RNA polymerase sigma factor [Tautonia plasticadhaerens]|uniref:Thiol-disulfide oxidoreductase ResA n=1 Tax=Tautonia plasticadhaerens TaxID=2527974 RepID=A0A518GWB6_9BACT|nr:sigma-70 family RNA polymerase sigma factor [Tautonia plasticadhaerens]QDV32883.1 Thiol-disulfide oxidoreductase ResA [Tautonia plasticadhaerens]
MMSANGSAAAVSGEILDQTRALFGGGVAAGLSDAELLERFARRRPGGVEAETAFGVLVARHGAMVLGVCRRTLRDPIAAEDAFQATFLVLARKAGTIRVDDSIGRWLYGVSRRVAAKARHQSARRRAVERPIAGLAEPSGRSSPVLDAHRADLRAVIAEELARLPGPFREAVALCDLEGCTHDEAARRLGWPVGSVRSRLSRGRARLRDQLSRRGVSPSTLTLAPLTAPSLPPALLRATTTAALAFASAGRSASLASPAAALAVSVLRGAAIGSIALGSAAVVSGIVLTLAALVATAPKSPPPPPAPAVVPVAVQEGPSPLVVPVADHELPEARPIPLPVRVVEAGTGQAIPGARVSAQVWQPTEPLDLGRSETDARGETVVQWPADLVTSLNVLANADGYVPMRAWWRRQDLLADPPSSLTFELVRGEAIGGIVEDERGEPIPDAIVYVWVQANGPGDGRARWSTTDFPVRTDARGRWQAPYLPPGQPGDARVLLRLEHPDFVSEPSGYSRRHTADECRSLDVVEVMQDGVPALGRVVDSNGRPVVGARVNLARAGGGGAPVSTETNADGRFRFGHVSAPESPDAVPPTLWRNLLPATVERPGFATTIGTVRIGQGAPETEIRLAEARPIGLRVVDPEGRPIAGAIVTLDELRAGDRGQTESSWIDRTDAEGRIVWPDGPAEGEVEFRVDREPYLSVLRKSAPAGAEEAEIVLRLPPRVSLRVLDASTGDPIDRFEVTPGISLPRGSEFDWSVYGTTDEGRDGQFDAVLDELAFEPSGAIALKVEAEGYAPAVTERFEIADEVIERTVSLSPSVMTEGTVFGPDGTPVAGAEVIKLLGSGSVSLGNRSNLQAIRDELRVTTGSDGRFALDPEAEPFGIAVIADEGMARVGPARLSESAEVRLVPWARLSGRYFVGEEPQPGKTITVSVDSTAPGATRWVQDGYEVTTDADGRFELDRVVPGFAVAFSPTVGPFSFEVGPGEVAEVVIGGSGRPVVGRIEAPDEESLPIPLDRAGGRLLLEQRGFPEPEELAGRSQEERVAHITAWYQTPEGREWRRRYQGHTVRVGPDGSFRIPDVAPGSYTLTLHLSSESGSRLDAEDRTEIRATIERAVEVPEGDGPIDLGTIPLEVETIRHRTLSVGQEAPDFELQTLDGDPVRLADQRGKVVLLHFWATWCGPCLEEEPTFEAIWEEFGGDDRFTLIGLSLDEEPEAARIHVEARGFGWTQAVLGPWGSSTVAQDFGVESIPRSVLIGPDGRVIASRLRGPEIRDAVASALAR